MITLDEAVTLDRDRFVVAAADAYEDLLTSAVLPSDETTNLMVLYWQSTDYGFSSAYALPPSFVARAGDRLEQLLATDYCSDTAPEPFFWKKYIDWVEFEEPFSVEESEELIRMHPDYIEPSFHVFYASGGNHRVQSTIELRSKCQENQTVRASYVASIIDSTMMSKSSTKSSSSYPKVVE